MTTAAPERTPKAILVEALDTIKATFWITGAEFRFAEGTELWSEQDGWTYDYSALAEITKKIEVTTDSEHASKLHWQPQEDGTRKALVTGVCSIGAIAIANTTLYGEKLEDYGNIANRDLVTFLAAAALSQVILHGPGGEKLLHWADSPASLIPKWNDSMQSGNEEDRQKVIAAFTAAIDHPLASATEYWEVKAQSPTGGNPYSTGPMFATEQEAEEFIRGDSDLLRALEVFWNTANLVVERGSHQALQPS